MRTNTVILLCMILFLADGCGTIQTNVPLPKADAPFGDIWSYASSLDVTGYAKRRFRSYPEGLRKAITKHRIDFFSTGKTEGSLPDIQCYLFFEYRRQRNLPAGKSSATPADKKTEQYVRALVQALQREDIR